DFTTLDLIEEKVKYDKNVIFSGIIISVKAIFTKQNRKMCFIELEDIYGKIEAVVFPQIYEKYKEILIEDKAVLINGKLQINDNRAANIIINNIREINNEIFSQNSERNGIIYEDKVLYLKMKYSDKNIYSKIRNELLKYKGKSEVVIYFYDISKSVSLKNIKINLDLTLINSLVNLLGNDSVIIK
ncbi:OB-fold nucleic acid binding domain-containing protein, partial [Helcococcus ovis]